MTKEKQSVGEQIYSGVATFGRVWAVVSAIFGTIISIGLLILGIYIIRHKSHLLSVPGSVVEDSKCTTSYSQQRPATTCRTKISYDVDGTNYTQTVDTGAMNYGKSSKVTVWYSPGDPSDPELNPATKGMGWILIVIVFFICFGSWIWVWVTRKSKVAAVAGGAIEDVSLLTGR